MKTYPSSTRSIYRPAPLPFQVLISLIGGMSIFIILLFGTIIGYDAYYAGQIYPGVSVAGVDLSGMEPADAALALVGRLNYPSQGRILLRDGDKIWLASPAQLGFHLDPQSTALDAFREGRQGGPLARIADQFLLFFSGKSLPAQYVFDERAANAYLSGIAAQNDIQAVEASLSINGVDVVVNPGKIGRSLDITATMDALRAQVQSLSDGEVPLVISETKPAILNVDEQAQVARQILSSPLTLVVADEKNGDLGPWTFEPDVLASMLTIERVSSPEGDQYQVGLQAEGLRSFLEGIAPKIQRTEQNARFVFDDDTRKLKVIQHAVVGRELDIDQTIESINQKLMGGDHNISLDVKYTQPQVGDDAKAKDLGITELVSSYTSYFYGSSQARIQNISTAAARFHGVLVPPGATFSMGDVLGDVSLDNGYAEALIIFGNRTIQGVGGGVCQVSTTLFRTAFFGGYPIVERYPHAYRVYYYEQTSGGGINSDLAGLDATVYEPLVDFKFANDTPYWLLMETYVDPATRAFNWRFYSTSDGRQVDWHTSGLQNIEEPPKPLYEENPDLAKGEVEQVDWEVQGADVTVTRTVTRDGDVLYDDTFTTHYMPWRAVYQYGPGTKGMPPDKKGNKDN